MTGSSTQCQIKSIKVTVYTLRVRFIGPSSLLALPPLSLSAPPRLPPRTAGRLRLNLGGPLHGPAIQLRFYSPLSRKFHAARVGRRPSAHINRFAHDFGNAWYQIYALCRAHFRGQSRMAAIEIELNASRSPPPHSNSAVAPPFVFTVQWPQLGPQALRPLGQCFYRSNRRSTTLY